MGMNFALKAALVGIALNVVVSFLLTMLPLTPVEFLNEFIDMAHHHKKNLASSSLFVALGVGVSVLIAKRIKN